MQKIDECREKYETSIEIKKQTEMTQTTIQDNHQAVD